MNTPDLWTFALACYGRPGVESACLTLQAHGADVCLLLCGAWLEIRGQACTAQRQQQLRQLSGPWQAQVIQPLRKLRQDWRAASGQDPDLSVLRKAVKALELDAERTLLERLEHCTASWPAEPTPARCLEALIGSPAAECGEALETLRQAARGIHLAAAGH